MDYPHMSDTRFPHISNVDVYKYKNEFDYSRFDDMQMGIMLCSVPWDMGEAHIGNRTISGIGNVVWFETEENRDAWFEAVPDDACYRFQTKYKQLHRDNAITVPVPFDVASLYNYLVVDYAPFASENDYVEYESPNGLRKWFWFVREVEFLAPNSTKLHLMNDAFQTFMYRIHVAGMVLERGHAPLFAIDADTYLANPMENNSGLLAEDVNYGNQPARVRETASHVFNDETYACVATTANVTGTWGSKDNADWITPALSSYVVDGVPVTRIFCMEVSDLVTFLQNVKLTIPQFTQTVKGVFFAPKELISTGASFTFADTPCNWVSTSNEVVELVALEKTQFGYPAEYSDLAKLYTWPYACLEVTDENGNTDLVRIEDTSGTLDISASLSLAFPALSIQAHLLGIGGTSSRLTFSNITSRSLSIGGRWYEYLHEWDVPTFGVFQSANSYYDHAEYYDRVQANLTWLNAYDSSIASANAAQANANESADTTRTNAYDSADANYTNTSNEANTTRDNALDTAATAHGNANRSADVLTANATLNQAANTALTTANNAIATDNATKQQTANNAYTAQANNYTQDTSNNQIDATLQSAAVSAASGVMTSGAQAVAAGISGNPVGAVAGIVGGVVNAGAAVAQASISTNLTASQASLAVNQNSQKNTTANGLTADLATNATSNETVNTQTKNNLIGATATNTSTAQKANATDSENLVGITAPRSRNTAVNNASRTRTTDKGNASRTRTTERSIAERTADTAKANAGRVKDTAVNAIANRIKQNALKAPEEFGVFANTGQATTKPMALIANVLTQTDSAIKQAGDEFLRYGYMYNAQWPFDGNWNIGAHFTYWKLSDFWVRGLNIPDMYVDKLRFFLYGGVTIWRKPEDIGNVTIYENWED